MSAFPLCSALKKSPSGHTQPLLPRVVRRLEVRVNGDVAVAQLFLGVSLDDFASGVGEGPAEFEEDEGQDEEFPPDDGMCEPSWEPSADKVACRINGWESHDITGTALEDGDLGSLLCQVGE